MKNIIYVTFLILSILSGCEEADNCCIIPVTDELSGTWLFYEYGYSPGFGYETKAVTPIPPQTLTFNAGKVSSNLEGFEDIVRYAILTDAVTRTPYVALYKSDKDTDPSTYAFTLSDNVLKLHFRYCYEGCHIAFKML